MKTATNSQQPETRSARPVLAFLLAAGCLLPLVATAGETKLSKADSDFFESKIRPLLADNCYKCHSSDAPKLKGGLSLESREALLKGGESGPAIVPGHPETSLLIKAVSYSDPDLQMPPKGKKLSADQIATLTTWVKMGAPDPRTTKALPAGTAKTKAGSNHWAFQPVKKPAVPEVKNGDWASSPVDNFILAKLESNGMLPAAKTDKRSLLRRATFDLTGLPPTSQELNDFIFDDSPDAFAKVVDRLLASPAYGERWGRFWLDVARYSDTKGTVKKQRESFLYPHAWTYRDYVIRAFNEDKPFNQFIVEQLAADKLNLNNRSNLAAMGFLTVGDHFDDNANDIINDRIDVVTKGCLGLTVTCARCHDHKFDPIPQQDYYSLRGIFASSVEPAEAPLLSPIKMSDDYARFSKEYNALKTELATLRAQNLRNMTGEQRQKIFREQTKLVQQIGLVEAASPGTPARAMVLVDSTRPADSAVFLRGEAENRGPVVPRRFLEILSGPVRPVYTNGSGRLELAAAIVNPNNPLTARVIVNRVWMHHFGEGFVTTPDDFGNQSEPPSHPELLDYLASRFMAEGWSLKKLHRLIMLTSVYQESSANNTAYAEIDPHNRLLWRANIRRLELEAVRDSILAIGGSLDTTMGGHPVRLNVLPYSTRRTVYGYVDRQNLPEIYSQFDFANPDATTGKRYETLVPQQALFLMNSPLVIEQARHIVEHPEFRKLTDDEARIRYLYEQIYQRDPTGNEIKLGLNFIQTAPPPEALQSTAATGKDRHNLKESGKFSAKKFARQTPTFSAIPSTGQRPLDAWAKYAHALLQANETLFVT